MLKSVLSSFLVQLWLISTSTQKTWKGILILFISASFWGTVALPLFSWVILVKLHINLRQMLKKTIHSTISWKPASNSSLLWWVKQRSQAAMPLIYQRLAITFEKINYFPVVLLPGGGATLTMNFIVPAFLFTFDKTFAIMHKNVVTFLLSIGWDEASSIQANRKERFPPYSQILARSAFMYTSGTLWKLRREHLWGDLLMQVWTSQGNNLPVFNNRAVCSKARFLFN